MRFENAIGKNVKNAFQKCENVKKMWKNVENVGEKRKSHGFIPFLIKI